jgi:MerR family transcriptional regulator, light-induced transcriptional regulator
MHQTADKQETAKQLLAYLGERIEAFDRAGAVSQIAAAVREERLTVPDVYALVLTPYLVSVGSRWRHGSERVWQEHVASHIVRTVVEALYPEVAKQAASVPKLGRKALLACPPREQHELGLRMLSDRFELAGWDVVLLGADAPVEEIVDAAKTTHAELVALSVSTVYERVELRCFIDTLRTELPGVRVAVGGPAFTRNEGWPAEDLLDPGELGLADTSVLYEPDSATAE